MSKTLVGLDSCRIGKEMRVKITTVLVCLDCREMFFLTEEPQVGDLIVCPYCHQKNRLKPEEKDNPILKSWWREFLEKR